MVDTQNRHIGTAFAIVGLIASLITIFVFATGLATWEEVSNIWENSQSQTLSSGVIFGKVTDPEGEPIPGVNIILISDNDQLSTVTDPQGHFGIQKVPFGKYTLNATFVGYEKMRGTIQVNKSSTRISINMKYK